MANRIRTGRDGICSLWNFISRRTMKAFEEEEQRRYTHSLSLSLPFTSSLRSTFVVLPVLFFFLFFFIICHFTRGYRSCYSSRALLICISMMKAPIEPIAEREEYIFDSFRRELLSGEKNGENT